MYRYWSEGKICPQFKCYECIRPIPYNKRRHKVPTFHGGLKGMDSSLAIFLRNAGYKLQYLHVFSNYNAASKSFFVHTINNK